MAITYFKAPFNVGQLGAIGTVDTVIVEVRVNAEGGAVHYPADNFSFASGSTYTFAGGTGEIELPTKVGANPADFEYEVFLEVSRKGRKPQRLGPYYKPAPTVTTASPVATWPGESSVPASWMTQATAQLQKYVDTGAELVAGATGLLGALSGVRNPAALSSWHALDAGTNVKRVAVVAGDSILDGGLASSYTGTAPMRLQSRLRTALGVTGGVGYISAVESTEGAIVPDLPVTHQGTPVMWGHGLGGRSVIIGATDDHVTYAPQPCTKVRVYYGKTAAASGGMRVLIDGVDQGVTLSSVTAGANTGGHVWESPDLAPGTHAVKVVPYNSPFVGIVEGVEFINGDEAAGVRVYNGAHSGGGVDLYNSPGMAMHWQSVSAVDADVAIIMLGANDVASETAADFLAGMDAIIAKVAAPIPVLLVGCYLRGDYNTEAGRAKWAQMQAGLRARATGRVAYLDLAPHWPELQADGSTSGGLMFDTPPIHPNDAGMDKIATVLTAGLSTAITSPFIGPQGQQGLPGVNAIPAKAAVDAYNAQLIDEESETRDRLNAAIASAPPAEAFVDYSTHPDGAPTLDSGQDLVLYRNANSAADPIVVGGRYTNAAASSSAYTYTESELSHKVRRIGGEFTFTTGTTDGGAASLVVWKESLAPTVLDGAPPDSPCHLVITPTSWNYGVFNGNLLSSIRMGYFAAALPVDVLHRAEVVMDGDVATVFLPDGQVVTLKDSRIAANAGRFACWEVSQTTNSGTDKRPGFVRAWGDSRTHSTYGVATSLATIRGPRANQESGDYAEVRGTGNVADGDYSYTDGKSNIAGGNHAHARGEGNTANGHYSDASGLRAKTATYGAVARASGRFAADGDAQRLEGTLRIATADATPAKMGTDGTSLVTGAVAVASSYQTMVVDALVVAQRTNGGANESAAYRVAFAVKRVGTVISFLGTPSVTVVGEDIAGWDVAPVLDTVNRTWTLQVTGAASTAVRWVATFTAASVSI